MSEAGVSALLAALYAGASTGGGGGGGSGYPALTLASPAFVTGKNGQALSGGTATGQFLAAEPSAGDIQFEAWIKASGIYAGGPTGNDKFITFTDSSRTDGNTIGVYFDGSGVSFGWGDYNYHFSIGGSSNVADGAWHHLMLTLHNAYSSTYVNMFWDGVSKGHSSTNQLFFKNPVNVAINMAKTTGGAIDSIKFSNWAVTSDDQGSYGASPFTPQALFTRDGITAMLCQLDGNGTGS